MVRDRFLSVDSARLTDLSILGWAGVGLSLVSAVYGVYALTTWAVVGGGLLEPLFGTALGIAFGGGIAYNSAMPDYEGTCDHCGDHVRVNASRDGTDELVTVEAAGTPRRARLGRLSAVLQTERDEWWYCSAECASADKTRRSLVGPADLRQQDLPGQFAVTATDGGRAESTENTDSSRDTAVSDDE